MLTFNVILRYQGLLFQDVLRSFLCRFFFSIRPTDRISGNAVDAERKKKGWPYHRILFLKRGRKESTEKTTICSLLSNLFYIFIFALNAEISTGQKDP